MNEMRIVLVGKWGAGKSAVGNSLLMENHFKSSPLACSVTSKCKFGARKLEDGTNLVIVDTPGIFDTSKTGDEIRSEISRCIGLSSPGPHAFFFVLKIGARFTEEEKNTIDYLKHIFGKLVMKFVIVVFTSKDLLEQSKISLDEYVRRAPPDLIQLIQDCNGCYVAINNMAKPDEKEEDVQEMLNFARKTMERNRGMHYTGEMFEEAEKLLKEKLRLLEEEKNKKKRELEQRERNLEEKDAKMKKELEEEMAERRKALEEEQRQLDLEVKRKEEELPRETERINKIRHEEELEQQRHREMFEEAQREMQKQKDRDTKERDEERRKIEKEREDKLREIVAEHKKNFKEAQREMQ